MGTVGGNKPRVEPRVESRVEVSITRTATVLDSEGRKAFELAFKDGLVRMSRKREGAEVTLDDLTKAVGLLAG